MAKKRWTRAQLRAAHLRLIDTEAESEKWGEDRIFMTQSCRWLDRAARLYGIRRVEAALRKWDGDDDFHTGRAWVEYWRRWRARRDLHLIPWAVLSEGYAPMIVGERLATMRQAAAEGPRAVAA